MSLLEENAEILAGMERDGSDLGLSTLNSGATPRHDPDPAR